MIEILCILSKDNFSDSTVEKKILMSIDFDDKLNSAENNAILKETIKFVHDTERSAQI